MMLTAGNHWIRSGVGGTTFTCPSAPVIDRNWPILLKKSRRDFCPRKRVVDVEIWSGKKAKLSWILRSNAQIERF